MKDENIKQLVEQTLEKHSKIDILVNNAAMDMATISCSFMDAGFLNKYDNALRLELDVPIKICRLTMPYLIESKGSIINVSSVAAKRPVNEGMLHSVCKAAIEAMTKCLALEFGPKGVRVNTVNPGFVRTPQTEPYLEDPHSLKQAKSYSVFHQVGEAEEIAFAVAFLASNASNFVTGTNLLVDGGFLLK
ncbi:tropinone reductase-like protein [Dinothrombium tinctorium]|uniref:Tropinone reductase-like protein n=1 Tax=Dinothrombium tinctorium TaxID=1965070 RepID=A0A3S3NJT4_9ACAR|nr:tropinone reductase-like protein [Dinothrombium tinctorium]RWS03770.1 tropinone reductase-like protein [Dinothrombium tinctorium]RWS04105.1 tropinone reductase-like protein [Dinothrombium tinctorium]